MIGDEVLRELRDFFRSLVECYFGKRCAYCWREATCWVASGFTRIDTCMRHSERAARVVDGRTTTEEAP